MDPHAHEARERRIELYEAAVERRGRYEPLFYEKNDESRTKDETEADGAGEVADGQRACDCGCGLGESCPERPRFSTALDRLLEQHAQRDVQAG